MAILYLLVQLPHLIHEKKIKYCFVPHNSLSCTSVWWLSLFILQSPFCFHIPSPVIDVCTGFCAKKSIGQTLHSECLWLLQPSIPFTQFCIVYTAVSAIMQCMNYTCICNSHNNDKDKYNNHTLQCCVTF